MMDFSLDMLFLKLPNLGEEKKKSVGRNYFFFLFKKVKTSLCLTQGLMVLTKEIFVHYGQELKVVVNHTAQKEIEILKLEADLRK